MKSITIHGLDQSIADKIKRKAKDLGLSLNKTIKKLLEESLGLGTQKDRDYTSDFMDLYGVWQKEEEERFLESVDCFEKISREDWA